MSQNVNVKKSLVALVAFLMACTALVAVMSEDTDAADADIAIGSLKATDFKEKHDGTLSFGIANNSNQDVTITVNAMEGSSVLKSTVIVMTASQKSTDGKLTFQLGSGGHSIRVFGSAVITGTDTPVDVSSPADTITIHVDKSIWSGWAPYVALVIVALIIVLMIYVWSRGRPAKKPAVTFSDLEEGKVSAPAASADTGKKMFEAEPKEEKKSSGRMKYISDRRK